MPTAPSVPEFQGNDVSPVACSHPPTESVACSPAAGFEQPSPAASEPLRELIDAAPELVYALCPHDKDAALSCSECQRASIQGEPIRHAAGCKIGRVIRAATRLTSFLAKHHEAHGAPELRVRGVPEDDLASPVASDESWQASEALLHPVRVEPDPDREQRRVVCGRAVNVFGHPHTDVLTCHLDARHGDAWHEDHGHGIKWPADCFSVLLRENAPTEYRRLGAEPIFVHPASADEAAR